ncbi:MAG TPA: hypothetical protein VGF16_12235 [Bryobacteraceae bacterium]|jgi:hypothetical protein
MHPVRDDTGIIEERLRYELDEAFTAVERADEEQEARARTRLNRAVRRLYDFIGYGKIPQDWQVSDGW